MGNDEPMAQWERRILRQPNGQGDVTFTRIDGLKVTINDARVDSIGPGADGPMVVAVEFFDSDRIVHVPFVQSWEVNY